MGIPLQLHRKSRLSWTRQPPARTAMVAMAAVLAAVMLFSLACNFSGDKTTLLLNVGSELKDCVGVPPMKCLVVNGELFYETIEGFDHDEGFKYRLKVERQDLYTGEEEPPEDATEYRYRLIEIMSKMAVAPLR